VTGANAYGFSRGPPTRRLTPAPARLAVASTAPIRADGRPLVLVFARATWAGAATVGIGRVALFPSVCD